MTPIDTPRKVSAEAQAVIRATFACGEALGATIAQLGTEAALPPGTVLWPLPGRDETSLLTHGRAQELAYGREGAVLVLHAIEPGELPGRFDRGGGCGQPGCASRN